MIHILQYKYYFLAPARFFSLVGFGVSSSGLCFYHLVVVFVFIMYVAIAIWLFDSSHVVDKEENGEEQLPLVRILSHLTPYRYKIFSN